MHFCNLSGLSHQKQISMFGVGVIADIQYAPVDDAWDFHHTSLRKYRQGLDSLAQAVEVWRYHSVRSVVNLGDLIDGRNKDCDSTEESIVDVMAEFSKLPKAIQAHHLIGNHDLYNFTRKKLVNGVNSLKCSNDDDATYYSFELCPGWLGVVLDGYEVSAIREGGGRLGKELRSELGNVSLEGFEMCQRQNPNDLSIYGADFFRGIKAGPSSRWAPYNGAHGQAQKDWLDNTLHKNLTHKVVIFSHLVIHPNATPNADCRSLCWDSPEILEIINKYKNVKIVFAGHAHRRVLFRDETTVHFTFPSPIENSTKECSGILWLSENEAKLQGFGFEGFQMNF